MPCAFRPAAVAVCLLVVSVCAAAEGVEVLNTDSFYRWDRLERLPCIDRSHADADPAPDGKRRIVGGEIIDAPVRPAETTTDWASPDHDDADWPRTRARWLENLAFKGFDTGTVRLRGRFVCDDPRQVRSLKLSAELLGGMVVYLNGREVARAHVPAGQAGPPADPYPDAAWATSRAKAKAAAAARPRTLEAELPPKALRKGTNVLAVAVHRSDYHPSATAWNRKNRQLHWLPCGLRQGGRAHV